MIFHMLFEQSGTFKNVFKSYGHEAYDYDILNDYGQTDFQIDLFKEIETAYQFITEVGLENIKEKLEGTWWDTQFAHDNNIFFKMNPETDFIMAFFPCTYFSTLNELMFRAQSNNGAIYKNNIPENLIKNIIKRNAERKYFYEIFIKMCFVFQELKIRAIIENPASLECAKTYLDLYSPYRPSWKEKDRSLFGDKFKKPTHFYSINFEMKENFIMYDLEINKKYISRRKERRRDVETNQRKRSEITPRYANNFYKRFIEQQINSKF